MNSRLLVTGFEPFDGRETNASWVAASSLAAQADILQLPVIWGEPFKRLNTVITQRQPETIISLGEGRDGWFDIETRARNTREPRPDNAGNTNLQQILADGIDLVTASIDSKFIQQRCSSEGIPLRVSIDAGQFLCEETLYCLEHLKDRHDCLAHVLFVHVPPFGTSLSYRGVTRVCDGELLSDFAERLLRAVSSLAKTPLPLRNRAETMDNALTI